MTNPVRIATISIKLRIYAFPISRASESGAKMKNRSKIAWIIALGGCLALSMGIFAACEKTPKEHDHVYETWVTVTPANCLTDGSEKAACTVCGIETTRKIDALGHDWKITSSTPAKCTEDGVEARACSRCSASEVNVIAASGHTPGSKILKLVKNAKCTEDGEKIVECDVCGESVNVSIPKLGHEWEVETVVQEAICTEAGLQLAHCTRKGCGESGEVEIPALGHDWEQTPTIDKPASFEEAGSKSQHCSRCEEKTNVTEIPMLVADQNTSYTFRLVRMSGDLITIAGVKINIFDENGSSIGSVTFRNGKATAPLLPKNYTVRIDQSTLPTGYTAEESYSVGWANPTCTVTLTGSIASGTPAPTVRYTKGSAMYDFTYTTLATDKRESETIKLSELLKEYKIVVLNFWYVDCQFCRYEFPGMQAAYELYKEDVAIIAIDPNDASAEYIRNFVNDMGLGFYVTQDTAKLKDKFGVSAYPTTVVIDREGIVSEIHASALVNPANPSDLEYCTRRFTNLFAKYTNPPYYQGASAAVEYTLPEKRKI